MSITVDAYRTYKGEWRIVVTQGPLATIKLNIETARQLIIDLQAAIDRDEPEWKEFHSR